MLKKFLKRICAAFAAAGMLMTPAGALDQRAVSRMQNPHRRHEPDSGLLRSLQLRAELFDACEYFHLF